MSTLDNVLNAIDSRPHTKRKPYKNGFKMNNPFDASSDSHSFHIFDIRPDGEAATYHYFAGGESGTLYELAQRLGVQIAAKRHNVENTKREYSGIADYAQAHGVSVEYLKQCRWQEVQYQGRPALQFDTAGGKRYRFLDNGSNKYTSESGYTICWYGLDDAVKRSQQQGVDYIILCNGEISTITAKESGLPAFCKTSGESALSEPLLEELRKKWEGKIYIALDCDAAGRSAAQKIAEQLDGRGIVIDLMLSEGGDLADFCKLHSDESLVSFISLVSKQTVSDTKNPPQHDSEKNRSDKVVDSVLKELSGDVHIRQVSFLFPIRELRQFGGFAELCETGKITLIAGGSGTGKTQFLETMNDRLNREGISGLWFGAEWRADEMIWRRFQRWTNHLNLTSVSYDDIRRHRLFIKEQQMGVSADEMQGSSLNTHQWEAIGQVAPFLREFSGTTEYFDDAQTLSDTLDAMRVAIEREKRNGREILYIIFDYVQLLKASSPDSSVNRYEHAFEVVKAFASEVNVHIFMTSQVNKVSQTELSNGKGLNMESAHFIRGDKANLFLTLNRQHYKRGEDWIETPAFYLTIVKASLGGRPVGYTEPELRIPMIMNPKELRFITSVDWRELDTEPFTLLPDNRHYTGATGGTSSIRF